MKKIGLVVAVEIESLLQKYGKPSKEEFIGKNRVYIYEINNNNLYVIVSGSGEVRAGAATQILITKYQVDLIVNFGVVGSLSKKLNTGDTCLVNSIVHYDFDTSDADKGMTQGRYKEYQSIYLETSKELLKNCEFLKLPVVTCASGDKFVSKILDKLCLKRKFKADICDMESAGIVLVCDRNEVPCVFIKTVADSLFGGSKSFHKSKKSSSELCVTILDVFLGNFVNKKTN